MTTSRKGFASDRKVLDDESSPSVMPEMKVRPSIHAGLLSWLVLKRLRRMRRMTTGQFAPAHAIVNAADSAVAVFLNTLLFRYHFSSKSCSGV